MDRREFVQMGAAAATTPVLTRDLVSEALRATLLPGAQSSPAPGQAPGKGAAPTEVRITSEFMEDYTPGRPWGPSKDDIEKRGYTFVTRTSRSQVPLVASDGSLQFFTFYGGNPYLSGPDAANTVSRIFPDPDGITGWDVDQYQLQLQSYQDMNFACDPSGCTVNHLPTGVAWTPANNGEKGWFYLYSPNGLWMAPIMGPKGLGPFQLEDPTNWMSPLVVGQLSGNTRYIPRTAGLRDPSANRRFDMGDMKRRFKYPIEANAFALPQAGMDEGPNNPVQIFPLKGAGDGYYRCVVWYESGYIVAMTFVLDTPKPHIQMEFRVVERVILGQSSVHEVTPSAEIQGSLASTGNNPQIRPYGCCYVHEPVAGQVEVLIFDPRTGVTSVKGTYDPQSAAPPSWASPHSTSLPGWGIKSTVENGQSNIEIVPNLVEAFGETLNQFGKPLSIQDIYFYALGTWDESAGRLEIFLLARESKHQGMIEIWSTARKPNGSWEELVPVDRGCASVDIFDRPEATLLISKPNTGFEILTRGENGEWESDYIRIPSSDEQMLDTASYRVGINVTAGGVPQGGETVQLTVSAPTAAVVDQMDSQGIVSPRHVALSTHRPTTTTTDTNGIVWINVLLEDRLSFPTLYVDSPRFKQGRLKFELNEKVENFFIEVTPEKLTSATDPRSGKKLMQKPQNVDMAVEGVHKLMSYEKENGNSGHALIEGVPALKSDLQAYWVPKTGMPGAPANRVKYHPDCCWTFRVNDGVFHFTELTREQTAIELASLRVMKPGDPMQFGFLSDAWDALSDLATSVWGGVVSVAGAVFDAVSQTLHIVFEGIDFVVSAVLDTIERVMDAVSILLDAAGFVLGMAVNWILEQLGFLFDWGKIKARRTALKNLMYDGARAIPKLIPDPSIGAKAIVSKLEDLRGTLNSFRSSKRATSGFGLQASSLPSLPDLFSFGDVSVLPQATWMMDKLRDKFFKVSLNPMPVPIPDFQDAQATAMRKLALVAVSLPISIQDLSDLVVGMVGNADGFGASTFQPVLDLLLKKLDAIIQIIEDVATELGDVLKALWAHPELIVDWFDTTIQIPFVNGFYHGLTGNNLSALDVLCLIAAIQSVATGQEMITENEMETPHPQLLASNATGRTEAHLVRTALASGAGQATVSAKAKNAAIAANSFILLGVVFQGFEAFCTALGDKGVPMPGMGGSVKEFSSMVSKASLATSIGAAMCQAIVAQESSNAGTVDLLMEVLIPVLAAHGLFIGLVLLPAADESRYPDNPNQAGATRKQITDLAITGLNLYFLVQDIRKGSDLAIARGVLSLVQSLATGVVRQYVLQTKRSFYPPYGPPVFGGLIACLAAARAGIYMEEISGMTT